MHRKIFYLLLSLLAVMICIQPGFAQNESFYQEELTRVNPFYEGMFTQEEMDALFREQSLSSVPNLRSDSPSYSWSQFSSALRGKLKNFTSSFSLTFYTNTYYTVRDFVYDGFDAAFEHTGVPNEGDYLRWNTLTWNITSNRYDGGSYTYRYDLTIKVTYLQSAAQEQEVSNVIGSVASSLKPANNTDGAKIRAVYNYVMNRIEYTSGSNHNHSTHAALIDGEAVCQGYATLMYRLLLMLGIDNRVATSATHAWNLAKAGSLYYHIDATWGDTGKMPEAFFLKNYSTIRAYDSSDGEHIIEDSCWTLISGIRHLISTKNYSPSDEKTPTPTPTPTKTPVPADDPTVSTFGIYRVYDDGSYKNVTKSTIEIDAAAGETVRLKAIAPYNASPVITWKNGAAKVAKITASGNLVQVTGLSTGNAKITASYKEGKKTYTAAVTVKIKAKVQPDSILINGAASVAEKKTIKLSVIFNQKVQPTNKKVTWSSENKSIATVSSAGVVKGVRQGDTTIYACSKETPSVCGSWDVMVTPVTQKVVFSGISSKNLVMEANTTPQYTLTAVALNAAGTTTGISQDFTWKSSAPKIVSVDQNGTIRALKVGKATITATAADGSKKSAKVNIKVTSEVQPHSLYFRVTKIKNTVKNVGRYKWTFYDSHYTFKPYFEQTVAPTNKKVVWMSTNPNALTVTSSGTAYPNITWIVNHGGYHGEVGAIACPKEHVYNMSTGKNTEYCSIYVFNYNYNIYYDMLKASENAEFSNETFDFEGLGFRLVDVVSLEEYLSNDPNAGVNNDVKDVVVTENTETVPAAETVVETPEAPEAVETTEPEPTNTAEAVEVETLEPTEEFVVTAEPHFSSEEAWMLVGERLVLDIVNPDGEAVMVGLIGDTDAVEWDEAQYMLTSDREAEVTAFMTSANSTDILDMMSIHIVSEIPEVEEVSEEIGEAFGMVIEMTDGVTDGTGEGVEGEEGSGLILNSEGEERTELTDQSASEENTAPVDQTEGEEPEAPVTDAEEPAAETAPLEIRIRDLGEYDELNGEENAILTIERERFELDDEIMSGLKFEIENEAVAALTEQSAEEMLVKGIEIQLLAAGETKLVIKQDDASEPLREIRIVVSAAPVDESEEPHEEELFVTEEVLESSVEFIEEQIPVETDAEIIISMDWSEPTTDEIPAEEAAAE